MTTKTNSTELAANRDAALAAIPLLEAVPLGQPWAAADAEASRAIAEVTARARECMFPSEIRLVDPEVFAAFEFLEADTPAPEYAGCLADVHARSLETFPELAAFIRSSAVGRRVQRVGAALATRAGRRDDVGETYVIQLQRSIAPQLVGLAEFEPAATILAVDVPAMETRLDAARHRHEEHTRSEVERLEAERVAADEALAAVDRERRSALSSFFAARAARTFFVNGQTFTGAGVAAIVRGEAARDVVQLELGSAPIDLIESLRAETEAAEAVAKAAR